MKQLSCLALLLTLVCQPVFAQFPKALNGPESVGMSSERLEVLNEQMHAYVDKGQLSCVQTAIIRKGKLVHMDTYGYSDVKSKTELKEDDIFRIYSMSKPIVSVGLMMLHEKGMFQLSDPVHKYIPEFKDLKVHVGGGVVEPAKQTMKVIDLFRHTSGLGYGWGGGYVDSIMAAKVNRGEMETTGDLARRLTEIPLYYEPGTAWRYSLSTDVLGHLLEVISGQPLDEYLYEHVLGPLGMSDTHFEVPDKDTDRFITNYTPGKDGGMTVIDHRSMSKYTKPVTHFSGGGGLVSTAADYLKFCQMLLNGGELNGQRLLGPKTIELMTQDHTKGLNHNGGPIVLPANGTGFGLGFSVTESVAETMGTGSVGAYGWGGAAGTYFRIDPKEELIYLMMIQIMPYNQLQGREKFQSLVYQAIVK